MTKNRRARQAAMRQGGGKPPHSEEKRRVVHESLRRPGGGLRSAAACCRPGLRGSLLPWAAGTCGPALNDEKPARAARRDAPGRWQATALRRAGPCICFLNSILRSVEVSPPVHRSFTLIVRREHFDQNGFRTTPD